MAAAAAVVGVVVLVVVVVVVVVVATVLAIVVVVAVNCCCWPFLHWLMRTVSATPFRGQVLLYRSLPEHTERTKQALNVVGATYLTIATLVVLFVWLRTMLWYTGVCSSRGATVSLEVAPHTNSVNSSLRVNGYEGDDDADDDDERGRDEGQDRGGGGGRGVRGGMPNDGAANERITISQTTDQDSDDKNSRHRHPTAIPPHTNTSSASPPSSPDVINPVLDNMLNIQRASSIV